MQGYIEEKLEELLEEGEEFRCVFNEGFVSFRDYLSSFMNYFQKGAYFQIYFDKEPITLALEKNVKGVFLDENVTLQVDKDKRKSFACLRLVDLFYKNKDKKIYARCFNEVPEKGSQYYFELDSLYGSFLMELTRIYDELSNIDKIEPLDKSEEDKDKEKSSDS